MTKEQILKKATEKAIENDWKPKGFEKGGCSCHNSPPCSNCENEFDNILDYVKDWTIEEIIFNHDFAIALWGEKRVGDTFLGEWQYHLQQMVLEEEPIKYLKKFIK